MAEGQSFDRIFRASRPRAVAALTRYFRTVDLGEDAFQDACLRAVKNWPTQGVPKDPLAWLIMVGRNAGIDAIRKRTREQALTDDTPEHMEEIEARYADEIDVSDYRDDVLRLLFMCCHADIASQDQLALALKIVVGFSVAEVARALLVSPKTMEQRITRAKKKAALVAGRLETPSLVERTERLHAVSVMIYLLFNQGYSATAGPDPVRGSLCEEAIRLARLLLELFPSQPEIMGLLALCLFHHARGAARQGVDGHLIPLDEQTRTLWNRSMINEGRVLLEKALRHGAAGPFQIQAAISAVHCAAAQAEDTDWAEIEALYGALERVQPSPVVTLNRMVAVSKTRGAAVALEGLAGLSEVLGTYLYFHTTGASFHAELGEVDEAIDAYERALDLGASAGEERFIRDRLADLKKEAPNLSD